MKQKFEKDYYLGFDIGTGSVGWALTDLDYNIQRFNKKDMWGSRLFEEANVAEQRRVQRSARRRLKRRRYRLNILENIFRDDINKVDNTFFIRLKESNLWLEDKSINSKFTLFDDENYKDYDFYKKYPTVFHLRNDLVNSKEKKDIRLIYIALHSIFKSRGHFLYEGKNIDEIKSVEDLLKNLVSYLEENFEGASFSNIFNNKDNIVKILCDPKKRKRDKELEFKKIFKEKQMIAIFKLASGSNVTLNDLYDTEDYKETEKKKISFDDIIYEDVKDEYYNVLGEKIELLDIVKSIYDFRILTNILEDSKYISESKVKTYEAHKKDLKDLKYLFRKYLTKSDYDGFFKLKNDVNYSSYVGLYKERGNKKNISKSKIRKVDLIKALKNYLSKIDIDKVDQKDKEIFENINKRIELELILPKQRITDNGTIPYQVHEAELTKILENQSKYYEFLTDKDGDNISNKEKLLLTFKFRIPYYVGPLNTYHMDKGGNSWAIRKEEGKILPWNFEDKIDKESSAEKFIKRMTNKCTYLKNEDVLPRDSFVYCEYTILNELNKVRVNKNYLDELQKRKIIENLFMNSNKSKVTVKEFKKYLYINKISETNDPQIEGVSDNFNASFNSYMKFRNIFGEKLNKDIYKEISENVILWKCLYGEDKKIFENKVNKVYGNVLSKDEINKLNTLKFSGWGQISKKFLKELEFENNMTGEYYLSVMEGLYKTNYNLMQFLSSNFTLEEAVKEENGELKDKNYRELIEESYISPSIKRSVIQTIKIYEELKKIIGKSPKKIFIEVARGGEDSLKGKKIPARMDKLIKLYKKCGNDLSEYDINIKDMTNRLKTEDDSTLRQRKLYLYYVQMGKCMYTGKDIDLKKLLLNNDTYDIDHIYPRSKIIKDDSFDNLVLVLKNVNADKTNEYPIDRNIQNKMKVFWKFLKDKELISEEKYTRLTDTGSIRLQEFLERQLVSVRQSTKEVGRIINYIDPSVEIVYSKAGIVSDFRKKFEIVKVRPLNDLHHAKDAYLNIVCGNVYNTKYNHNKYYKIKNKTNITPQDSEKENNELNENFGTSKIFEKNIRGAWKLTETLNVVKENVYKNTPNVTMMVKEERGQLFDLLPLKKSENSNEIVAIKPKEYKGENINLNEKYGYYNALNPAYFVYVNDKEKGKTIERIKIVEVSNIKTKDDLIKVLNDRGYINIIDVKKIFRNQVIYINNYPYRIVGLDSLKKLEFKNFKQLFVTYKEEKILKDIVNIIEKNTDLKDIKYIKLDYLYDKQNKKRETHEEALKRYDDNFNEIYLYLVKKLSSNPYKEYMNAKKSEELNNKYNMFEKFSLIERANIILNILKLFNRDTMVDLKKINLSSTLGRLNGKSSNVIFKNEVYLLETSVTGLFSKKIKL
ncbi:type II CRISPR RNA-guided endonuclease Cas9 [Pseudostreptobacillus hongkongensis]|uniref:type II CRISPR RNA-guided endonuclease Cas9 n=1 Tax=Pseudostreptobacillus hongkongensis TaxID=1162717 RepID=UPI0028D04425|nr:type II CRISPR RNA-guided endonuclease Cas9 [Pseudostreptobacillus hongkongensis]